MDVNPLGKNVYSTHSSSSLFSLAFCPSVLFGWRLDGRVHLTSINNKTNASKASKMMIHISRAYTHFAFVTICFIALMGCSHGSLQPTAPIYTHKPTTSSDGWMPAASIAEWKKVSWDDVPGWNNDRISEVLPAFLNSCHRAHPSWRAACAASLLIERDDEDAMRQWAQQYLQPWQITDKSGNSSGLLTGYYEPTFKAKREPDADYRYPVYAPPPDLQSIKPYWSRQEIDSNPSVIAKLRPYTIAYLADPIDAVVLHIQGSGRLIITNPEGATQTIRLAYAAHNGHAFQSMIRWLTRQGWITPSQASWNGIRQWMTRNPARISEALWSNPRFIFFREEAVSHTSPGPKGAQGVALTPKRSIAIDPRVAPYGTLMWIQGAQQSHAQRLERLVVAQDTGGAITGAVRADFFWGWDPQAEEQANKTYLPLQWWGLWPVETTPHEPDINASDSNRSP